MTTVFTRQTTATGASNQNAPLTNAQVDQNFIDLNTNKLEIDFSNAGSKTANYFWAAPDGTAGLPTFRAIVAADIPTLNQSTTGSAATLTTARTLTIGSTGKTFDGSANISWSLSEIGAQALDADLTAIAALAGTSGLLKKTAADTWTLDTNTYLTGNQSITLSGDASGTGTTAITVTLATVPVSKGGTGATTKTAAFNALTPMTTVGDTEYHDGTNGVRLAGNTTTTKQFLRSIGTGTAATAPAWDTLVNADIPTALTGKTYNALTLTAAATGFTIAGGTTSKTLTVSNTLTLSGTDSSTLNIGSGGTLGSAAFTASTEYEHAITTLANTKGGTGQNSSAWTGLVKTAAGVWSTATAGTDYVAPGTTTTFTTTQNFAASGITLKGSSTGLTTFASANASATGYTITFPASTGTVLTTAAAVTVGQGGTGATTLTGVLKGNGTSAFTAATAGTDYVAPGTATNFTAPQRPSLAAETAPTTNALTWDLTANSVMRVNLNANITTLTLNGTLSSYAGYQYQIVVRYNGGTSITWPATVKWPGGTAPTLTGTSGKIDIFNFVVASNNGGTTFYLLSTGSSQNL